MHNILPSKLYTCEQVRHIDKRAIDEAGIPGIILMKRAAKAAFVQMLDRWPDPKEIIVLCGVGNNGGDGYIVAALAAQRKIPVRVFSCGDTLRLRGDAKSAYLLAINEGVEHAAAETFQIINDPSVLIVDAIVGTGFKGQMRYADTISRVNESICPVISLDLPSGLDGDSGMAGDIAIEADFTISFVGLKRGLMTGRGPALRGDLCFSALGIPENIYLSTPMDVSLISEPRMPSPKTADAHKGVFGHVLVVGGDLGMGGAALLAAEAALRSGAGMVSLATRPEHVPPALVRIPEVMCRGIVSGIELDSLLKKATVLVIGPGLGRSSWSEQLLHFALQSKLPIVIDADALNLVAGKNSEEFDAGHWVMTPHPGEAARLLDCAATDVQNDRFKALKKLRQRYKNSVVVLKGAGSLVANAHETQIANVGNPGMAVAGMGDVLSGIVGALIAQGLSRFDAAKTGVYVHARAGDLAVDRAGERGMFASDIIPLVRKLLNGSDRDI